MYDGIVDAVAQYCGNLGSGVPYLYSSVVVVVYVPTSNGHKSHTAQSNVLIVFGCISTGWVVSGSNPMNSTLNLKQSMSAGPKVFPAGV